MWSVGPCSSRGRATSGTAITSDEFFIVLKGHGHIYTDDGEAPSGEGDVVYSPRKCWHGFSNTSNADVVLVWGWMGAGSIEASGYEVAADGH